jgi:alpha-ketoglutarate-dependent taurine dioxygenase
LKIHTLPESGGDTLWASAYEAYDRLSPEFQKFLERLTAVHDAEHFKVVAERYGKPIRSGNRGAPDNEGLDLKSVHPVIRTNPVTGWKGLFVNKGYYPLSIF